MARDIPFVPRFYIDEFQYMKALGLLNFSEDGNIELSGQFNDNANLTMTDVQKLFNYNPTDYFLNDQIQQDWTDEVNITLPLYYNSEHDMRASGKKYVAVLGHNFLSGNIAFDVLDNNTNESLYSDSSSNIGVNHLTNFPPAYNGFSIQELLNPSYDEEEGSKIRFNLNYAVSNDLYKFMIGAISFGNIFDLSISPDLKMKMSYEYGVDEKESRSGSTLSNIKWFQKPSWGDISCWELDKYPLEDYIDKIKDDKNIIHRRSGRRVYDLQFTFMTADEMLATNPHLNTYGMNASDNSGNALTDADADGNLITLNEDENIINIHSEHSFYSQVVHKTLGFSIPFIFQPNKDSNRPQDFMLAKIDSKKGWSLNQIAPNLFRTKLRIKEVW